VPGNCALYAAGRHPLAQFAERDCKITKKIPNMQIFVFEK